MNENLIAKETQKFGIGVFAKKALRKGTLLMVFGGYVLTRNEEEKLPLRIRDIAITIDRNMVIGVTNAKQLSNADYVNHSCDPNSGIKGQISLVAMRNIKKGEQITFDYGTVLFRGRGVPKYELSCMCESRNCRKKITQYDWKLPDLQKRYKGFFPYYIQEEIDKLNSR
jgi:SET domain-containing protein